MFIGITSGVMGKEAVEGETLFTSNAKSINAAATALAADFGAEGEVTVRQNEKKPYQHGLYVGGTLIARIIDDSVAPKSKVPAVLRPAKAEGTPKVAATKAPVAKAPAAAVAEAPVKRSPGRPRKVEVAAPVEAPRRGRPAGSKNKPKAAAPAPKATATAKPSASSKATELRQRAAAAVAKRG